MKLIRNLFSGAKANAIECKSIGYVLMFHRIGTSCIPFGPYRDCMISPELFEQFLDQISQKYECLSGKELIQHVSVESGKPAILITFDDGFSDNSEVAAPLLSKFHIPALFFVSTGLISGDDFPYEYYMARQSYSECSALEEAEIHYESKRLALKKMDLDNRLEAIKRVQFEDDLEIRLMTKSQIAELSENSLFEIASHGHWHSPMVRLTKSEQLDSLKHSKIELENITGKPVDFFSYPYGSVDHEIRKQVSATQYSAAFTTQAQPVMNAIDPYLIPRFNVDSDEINYFLKNKHFSFEITQS